MQAYRKRLFQTIRYALDVVLPIPPLFELITDYADYVGCIRTIVDQSFAYASDASAVELFTVAIAGKTPSVIIGYLSWIDAFRRETAGEFSFFRPPSIFGKRRFVWPYAIRDRPSAVGWYFVAERNQIYLLNFSHPTVSVAGSPQFAGFKDAVGTDALFNDVLDLVCTSDGRTVYVADSQNHRIRSIDVDSKAVRTIAGDSYRSNVDGLLTAADVGIETPRRMTFYRSATDRSESVLYVTAGHGVIRRLDIVNRTLTTIPMPDKRLFPYGIDCSPNGLLVFSCQISRGLYVVDPDAGVVERITASPAANRLIIDVAAGQIWMVNGSAVYVVDAPPMIF